MKKLRSLLLCLLMLSALMGLSAQEWAVCAGGTDNDYVRAIVSDTNGNSYIIGNFYNTSDFGTMSLTSSGDSDIFVAKLDADGNWLWANRAGGTGIDYGYGITVDNAGNVYISGTFSGTAMFGIFPLISAGSIDVFVAKLTTDGTWLWANRGGGVSSVQCWDITTDDNGNCYITGSFFSPATFGTTSLTSAGGSDVFIAKLDTNGLWLWAQRAGGTGTDTGYGITSDGSNGLYVTGSFNGTGDFGTTPLTSAGNADIFVCKLDATSAWQWAVRAGGTSGDTGKGIAVDSYSRVYITGYFKDVADFGVTSLNGGFTTEIFVARLDENGFWVWAVRAGGLYNDYGNGIDTDSEGFVYVTGYFYTNAYFGDTLLNSFGINDIYIGKLDLYGNWLWARSGGSISSDYGYGIAADDSGSCYTSGVFSNTIVFGSLQLVSTGNIDSFVAKVSDPTPQIPQSITISNLGNDVIVDWDAVTLDTWDVPITPDYYIVYYNTDGVSEPYQYLTFIPSAFTQYVHQHAGFFSPNHFYRVTAVKFYLADRSGMEDYLNANLHKGMTEAEVKQALKNMGSGL